MHNTMHKTSKKLCVCVCDVGQLDYGKNNNQDNLGHY